MSLLKKSLARNVLKVPRPLSPISYSSMHSIVQPVQRLLLPYIFHDDYHKDLLAHRCYCWRKCAIMDPRVSTAHSSGEGGALPDKRGNRKLLQDLYFCDTIQPTYPFRNFLKGSAENIIQKEWKCQRRINQSSRIKMQHQLMMERINGQFFIKSNRIWCLILLQWCESDEMKNTDNLQGL